MEEWIWQVGVNVPIGVLMFVVVGFAYRYGGLCGG